MLGLSNGVKKKGVMVHEGKYLSTIRVWALPKEEREEEKSDERRWFSQEDL
jgi:hypothetical protein